MMCSAHRAENNAENSVKDPVDAAITGAISPLQTESRRRTGYAIPAMPLYCFCVLCCERQRAQTFALSLNCDHGRATEAGSACLPSSGKPDGPQAFPLEPRVQGRFASIGMAEDVSLPSGHAFAWPDFFAMWKFAGMLAPARNGKSEMLSSIRIEARKQRIELFDISRCWRYPLFLGSCLVRKVVRLPVAESPSMLLALVPSAIARIFCRRLPSAVARKSVKCRG
jgi:hypothetical protein